MAEERSDRRSGGSRARARVGAGVLALILSCGALGAQEGGVQPPAPQPCAETPGYSDLDFWVGEWVVKVGEQEVGRNRIEKALEGCAIEERWTGAGGHAGRSLFYFVPALGEWRQVWVTERATSPGGVKEKRLVERLAGGALRFQGEIPVAGGGSYLDRTTLTPLPGGRVRQVIEISTDGGATWKTTFDAEYVRASG